MFGAIRNIFKKAKNHQDGLGSSNTVGELHSEARPPAPVVSPVSRVIVTPRKPEQVVNNPVRSLYAEFVEPFKGEYVLANALAGVRKLINILEQHGDCSSVRTNGRVSFGRTSQRDVLARVSLKDHSRRVARIISALRTGEYPESHFDLIDMYITEGLAHDLGKIPVFGSLDSYSSADHPIIGAGVVRDCFAGHNVPWIGTVLQSIINHHRDSDDTLDRLLRQADRMARGEELVLF